MASASGVQCNCIIENLLEKSFDSRPHNEKADIINNKRPMPVLNINTPRKTFVRHFNVKIYNEIKWLCGCVKMQKLFCWPCLLFSAEISVWNKNGFDDLNNLSKARKRHEMSKSHIDAFVKLKQFKNQNRIEPNITEQSKIDIEDYNKTVTANRYILSKLIDVICFLSKQELAFREHKESTNRGNFIELVYLLTTSDNQLKIHLEKSTVFSDKSNRIQNDLIKSIENILLQEIKKEIDKAKFVAIIVDEITDGAQMSTVFRYMKENGNVEERFVGFTDVSDNRDANSLFNHIKSVLDKFQCVEKLIAQTYDGAVVMSGQHNEVQAKIKEISKYAIFVHCYAHELNVVFSQSVGYIKECKIFFQTITGIFSFFSKSDKRCHALHQEIKKRFPSITPIIWNYNSRTVNRVMEFKEEIILLFLNIIECPSQWDSDTTIEATGLLHYLTDFDFNFLLLIFHKIFEQSDILFDILQENNFNVAYCITKISQFIAFLRQKRNDFDSFWEDLEEDDISKLHSRKRIRLDDGSKKGIYKCLYYEIMDTLIGNCVERFKDIKSFEFLSLLDVNNFKVFTKRFSESSFNSLSEIYGEFFDLPKLRSELQYLYSCPDYIGKSLLDIKNIIINDDLNKDVLAELYNFISLILTIPSTSASAEDSFSTMKRIHTFARNSLSKERLSSLALISIEKELLNNLMESTTSDFYDKVINDFAEKNDRIELIYKK